MTDSAGIPLPPPDLRFMGEDDDRLVSLGQHLSGLLRRHGLREDSVLLDVGSGYGRLAIGLAGTDFGGRYHGVEILKKHVRWCRRELAPALGDRYRFTHLDVRNGRYNPTGSVVPQKVRFPAPSGSTDVVALFSVFTHMYESDIRRYLRQIRRVLGPDGVAVTTWFVFDAARLSRATDPDVTQFPMVNEINAVTRYSSPTDPLHAISYRESHVRAMIADAGLELRSLEYGTWCGDPGPEFQDVLVLAKAPAAPPASVVRRGARKVGRALGR